MTIVIGAVILAAFWLFAMSASAKTSDDKIQTFSRAIAFAEGFMDRDGNVLSENIPAQYNNPGDLSPGDAPGYISEFHSGSNVVRFPDAATGWVYLNNKVAKILAGKSVVNLGKGLNATISDIATKYAGDSVNWANNVASYLGVSPSITLRDWLIKT